MNIRQLKYFLTIAEEGKITAAANKLNISQPPLSNQLKMLENELGVLLFRRNTRSMELTEEGELLRKHAHRLLREYDGIMEEFENIKNGNHGTLAISSICSATMNFLPEFIKRFQTIHPDIDSQIFEMASDHVADLLENNTAELGILREPFDHSKYNYLYINNDGTQNTDDIFVAVSTSKWLKSDHLSNQIPFESLKDKPLIIHRCYEKMIRSICDDNCFKPLIVCTNENIVTSLIWAIKGMGIALMPKTSSQLAPNMTGHESLIIREITNPTFQSNTALIWSNNSYVSPTAQKFIEFIKQSST